MGIGMVEVVEVARLRQLVSMNFEQTCYAFPFLFFFSPYFWFVFEFEISSAVC